MSRESRTLLCFQPNNIQPNDTVFNVTTPIDITITQLKKSIHEECKHDPGVVSAKGLVLWKPNKRIPVWPLKTLPARFKDLGPISQFAKELEPIGSIAEVFQEQASGHLYLDVIVYTPSSDVSLLTLHRSFWGRGEDIFVKRSFLIPDPLSLEVDDNSEMLELAVIEHPGRPEQVFPFGLTKLLVVKIFEIFWNLLESEDQKWQTLLQSPGIDRFSHIHHATIITGQPGIGKSVFLTYVLLRRLVNGLTTIYCDTGEHAHIFDGTGVRTLKLSAGYRIPELDANPQCCALVNLGDDLSKVPSAFYPKLRKGRVVVATSPDETHWNSFSHEHLARICFMPTWKWGPLYIASLLFTNKELKALDVDHCKRVQEVYSIFGGIPRLCFRSLTPTGLAAQWGVINNALNTIKSLEDFTRATIGHLPYNLNTSHHLVRVEPVDAHWFETRTELLSNCIAERVFERIHMITKAQLSESLTQHLANPDARSKAGKLFEQAAHFYIRKGLTLKITSLSAKKHTDVSIPATPAVKSRYYSLSIRERPGSQNVHPDFLNLYMTPVSISEPSIDALFISPTYTTYLFQMTVGSHHPINFRGLDDIFNKLPAKARNDICFVFIVPARGLSGEFEGIQSTQSIDFPQGADTVKVERFVKFPQYVCRLDIDKLRA